MELEQCTKELLNIRNNIDSIKELVTDNGKKLTELTQIPLAKEYDIPDSYLLLKMLDKLDLKKEEVLRFDAKLAKSIELSPTEITSWEQRSRAQYETNISSYLFNVRDTTSSYFPNVSYYLGTAVRATLGEIIAGAPVQPSAVMNKIKKIISEQILLKQKKEAIAVLENKINSHRSQIVDLLLEEATIIDKLNKFKRKRDKINEPELLPTQSISETEFKENAIEAKPLPIPEENHNPISLPQTQNKVTEKERNILFYLFGALIGGIVGAVIGSLFGGFFAIPGCVVGASIGSPLIGKSISLMLNYFKNKFAKKPEVNSLSSNELKEESQSNNTIAPSNKIIFANLNLTLDNGISNQIENAPEAAIASPANQLDTQKDIVTVTTDSKKELKF